MRAMALAMVTGLVLAACSGEAGPAQNAADAADVAEIEAMHDRPPVQPISPERISYTDIEQNDLFGMGCGFAPEGRLAVMFLAQDNHGFLKLDGQIRALAPDKGSARLPMSAWSQYDGKEYTVAIAIDDGIEDPQEGIRKAQYPGSLTIRDAHERIVFEKTGIVGCGA